jgi:hypothetical protein
MCVYVLCSASFFFPFPTAAAALPLVLWANSLSQNSDAIKPSLFFTSSFFFSFSFFFIPFDSYFLFFFLLSSSSIAHNNTFKKIKYFILNTKIEAGISELL